MPDVDYLDAHQRHWEDAELLLKHERGANADHLYGMSAECGLKHVMRGLGELPLTVHGTPERDSDRSHVDRYWSR